MRCVGLIGFRSYKEGKGVDFPKNRMRIRLKEKTTQQIGLMTNDG